MASTLIARRRSAYMQIKRAGIVVGLLPVSIDATCAGRKLPAGWESNLRPSLPVFDNVQYVPSGCSDLAVAVPEANKLTALGLVRVKSGNNNYLSILASGSGVLGYELVGLGGTASPNPSKKTFDTTSGPFPVPSSIGSGTAGYGGFYGNLANGDYQLIITDDTGGVSKFTIPVTDSGPVQILKGSLGTPGSGGGGGDNGGGTGPVTPTDPPEYTMTGQVFISKSGNPDLMNINVITGQDSNGDWTYIIRDAATGNYPDKRYQGMGRGMMSRDEIHAGRYYGAYPGALSCTSDSSPSDSKPHCTQKIQVS